MYIIGVNANPSGHDASAAIVKDGKLIAFAEEERFTRRRYAFDQPPHNAIAFCLAESGITLEEVEKVAVGWDALDYLSKKGESIDEKQYLTMLFPKEKFHYSKLPKIEFIPHHIAHAGASYFTSGWDSATVVVLDGQGETESISLGLCDGNSIEFFKKYPINVSLGYFYAAASIFLGLGLFGAGKLMGLASYGKPIHIFPEISVVSGKLHSTLQEFDFTTEQDEEAEIIQSWLKVFQARFGKPVKPQSCQIMNSANIKQHVTTYSQREWDIAASVQNTIDAIVVELCKQAILITGIRRVVLSGGVALNCVTNSKLLSENVVDDLFIFPAANDAGVAVGAALYSSASEESGKIIRKNDSVYLGPQYTQADIESFLNFVKVEYDIVGAVASVTAKMISKGLIIGWFQGRMECGPRALGNRSILASPCIKDMDIAVNKSIKFRETWRPFAPSIIEESADLLLVEDKNSEYMLLVNHIQKKMREKLPAVTHIDGSCRPQIVKRTKNLLFWEVINEFKKITGIGAILNTSFNQKDEPIVCTPLEALRVYISSGLDALILGNAILFKNPDHRNQFI